MSAHLDWTAGGDAMLGGVCAVGHRWYLPKPRCPECGAAAEPLDVAGAGTVFAATTVHRRADGGEGAIGVALVDLDAGVRALVRCAPGTAIGQRVTVSVAADPGTGRRVPIASPVPAAPASVSGTPPASA